MILKNFWIIEDDLIYFHDGGLIDDPFIMFSFTSQTGSEIRYTVSGPNLIKRFFI